MEGSFKPHHNDVLSYCVACYRLQRSILTKCSYCPPFVPILSQIYPVYTVPSYLKVHFNILPSVPRSSKWTLSFRFSNQIPVCISFLPHVCHMLSLSHFSWFDHLRSANCEVPHYDSSHSLFLIFFVTVVDQLFKPGMSLSIFCHSWVVKLMIVLCHWSEEHYCPHFPKVY